MLFVKYLLMTGGIGMILVAVGILTYDTYLEVHYRRALAAAGPAPLPRPLRLSKKPNPPRWLDRDGERVIRKVVAGIGFEPMTFRL